MTDTEPFALLVVVVGAVGVLAVLSNRLSERIRIPTPAFFLVGAALAVQLVPALEAPPEKTVERLVTVALVCILFDGGMSIGWARFRTAASPILVVGVAGTFLTAAAAAVVVHFAFGFSWYLALLIATAVAPTDPAVVFSVLGQREVSGRSGTILEGESGVNDPVGIALMVSLVSAGHLDGGAFAHVLGEFVVQMGVGAAIGLAGGAAMLWFVRRVSLPSEALYPLRTLTCALLLYGVATLAHGSGFLAVFVAGIMLGDPRAPYKREVERFHAALASISEVVAFVALGLTVDLEVISRTDVWVPGLVLAVVVAFVIRPLAVGSCMIGSGLRRNERTFIIFAGLKGAVPILLGGYVLLAHLPEANRVYGVIVVVVTFSVLVQGTLVPGVARRLRLPMRTVELRPWSLGVRLRNEPAGIHELVVGRGARADGRTVGELCRLETPVWVSFVVRDDVLVDVRGDTELRAGDHVLVLADPDMGGTLSQVFDGAAADGPSA